MISEAVASAVGYAGEIHWDKTKPDGTKKQLDVTRLKSLGWSARISLAEGLESTVNQFREDLMRNVVRL